MGFFTAAEVKSKSRPEGKHHSCASCGLYKNAISPKLKESGNFKKDILNIITSPNIIEDKKGKLFQDISGKYLKKTYKQYGIDLEDDCLNICSVNCLTVNKKGEYRKPTTNEISCCRSKVLQIIEKYKPKVIMLFGEEAVESTIGYRWKKGLGSIDKWRGFNIPDRDFKAYICPVFSAEYVLSKEKYKEVELIWEQDIERAFSFINKKFPSFPNEEKQVQVITKRSEMKSCLSLLNLGCVWPDPNLLAVDIECTGLKPYKKGHEIVCISFCESPNRVSVIKMPKRKEDMLLLRKLLHNQNIGKIASNMKFEDTWFKVLHGITVNNWSWDTMQAAHILDNRELVSGLKFQAYINFGVIDYSSSVDSFLESGNKDANAFNKVKELSKTKEGLHDLMLYCGLDSLFEYKLALLQMEKIGFDPAKIVDRRN